MGCRCLEGGPRGSSSGYATMVKEGLRSDFRRISVLVFLALTCSTVSAFSHLQGAELAGHSTSRADAAEENFQLWLKHVRNTSDLPHRHLGSAPPELYTYPVIHEGNPSVEIPSAARDVDHTCKKRVIQVRKDGTGHYTSIQRAIYSIPIKNKCRVDIEIGHGVFREKIYISKGRAHVTLQGATHQRTIIVWNATAADKDKYGRTLRTIHSATVGVDSKHFIAKNLIIMNTAPLQKPGMTGHQAVAMRISGDMAACYNCQFYAHQDTLYDHRGRHYFKNCRVSGTVDFVFGNGRSFYEEAELYADAGFGVPGTITAQKRNETTPETGFSFVNSRITGSGMVYLGRAWGNDSRVVFANTYMDKVVIPQGWRDWPGKLSREKTVYYAQFNCTGPGADPTGRVKWSRILTAEEAAPFLNIGFINGQAWLEEYHNTNKTHH